MRISKLAVVVLIASISGCAWYHPTKNESQFNQDKYTCLQQSAQAFPTVMQKQTSHTTCQTYSFGQTDCTTTPDTYSSGDVNQSNRDDAFNSCMNANGWSLRWKQ